MSEQSEPTVDPSVQEANRNIVSGVSNSSGLSGGAGLSAKYGMGTDFLTQGDNAGIDAVEEAELAREAEELAKRQAEFEAKKQAREQAAEQKRLELERQAQAAQDEAQAEEERKQRELESQAEVEQLVEVEQSAELEEPSENDEDVVIEPEGFESTESFNEAESFANAQEVAESENVEDIVVEPQVNEAEVADNEPEVDDGELESEEVHYDPLESQVINDDEEIAESETNEESSKAEVVEAKDGKDKYVGQRVPVDLIPYLRSLLQTALFSTYSTTSSVATAMDELGKGSDKIWSDPELNIPNNARDAKEGKAKRKEFLYESLNEVDRRHLLAQALSLKVSATRIITAFIASKSGYQPEVLSRASEQAEMTMLIEAFSSKTQESIVFDEMYQLLEVMSSETLPKVLKNQSDATSRLRSIATGISNSRYQLSWLQWANLSAERPSTEEGFPDVNMRIHDLIGKFDSYVHDLKSQVKDTAGRNIPIGSKGKRASDFGDRRNSALNRGGSMDITTPRPKGENLLRKTRSDPELEAQEARFKNTRPSRQPSVLAPRPVAAPSVPAQVQQPVRNEADKFKNMTQVTGDDLF